ncbi:MAG: hypothetical protein ACT4PV_14565 [Planctomycetaceae bacterium]
MPSPIVPEARLRSLQRKLESILFGRRLSADSESSGVVDLSDYATKCRDLAEFAAKSVAEMRPLPGKAVACACDVAEEVELAAREAALFDTLPLADGRIVKQCEALEGAAHAVAAALAAECKLEEAAGLVGLGALAEKEKQRFAPFVSFSGRIESAAPVLVDRGALRRSLRRAILDHVGATLEITLGRDGVLRFAGREFTGPAPGPGLARSGAEPPEVKRALDLLDASHDPALRGFLLVKAVDEALFALLGPSMGQPSFLAAARAFPTKPGKRGAVRPEAVRAKAAGWDAAEAARAVEKVAERRAGPEWARLPKGAYLLRLFVKQDDALTEDLLALGPVLRQMEKGVGVPGEGGRAERALRGLLGLLG